MMCLIVVVLCSYVFECVAEVGPTASSVFNCEMDHKSVNRPCAGWFMLEAVSAVEQEQVTDRGHGDVIIFMTFPNNKP